MPFTIGQDLTCYPADVDADQMLTAYEDDPMGRVLVRPTDIDAWRNAEWTDEVDARTGLAVQLRRTSCGSACECAAEVRLR